MIFFNNALLPGSFGLLGQYGEDFVFSHYSKYLFVIDNELIVVSQAQLNGSVPFLSAGFFMYGHHQFFNMNIRIRRL